MVYGASFLTVQAIQTIALIFRFVPFYMLKDVQEQFLSCCLKWWIGLRLQVHDCSHTRKLSMQPVTSNGSSGKVASAPSTTGSFQMAKKSQWRFWTSLLWKDHHHSSMRCQNSSPFVVSWFGQLRSKCSRHAKLTFLFSKHAKEAVIQCKFCNLALTYICWPTLMWLLGVILGGHSVKGASQESCDDDWILQCSSESDARLWIRPQRLLAWRSQWYGQHAIFSMIVQNMDDDLHGFFFWPWKRLLVHTQGRVFLDLRHLTGTGVLVLP